MRVRCQYNERDPCDPYLWLYVCFHIEGVPFARRCFSRSSNAPVSAFTRFKHVFCGGSNQRRPPSCEGRVSSFACSPKHKSEAHSRKPQLALETTSLIKQMAANNRLWGAERIRGERAFAGCSGEQTNHPKERKFGPDFARVASTSSIKVLRTPYRTRPRKYHL